MQAVRIPLCKLMRGSTTRLAPMGSKIKPKHRTFESGCTGKSILTNDCHTGQYLIQRSRLPREIFAIWVTADHDLPVLSDNFTIAIKNHDCRDGLYIEFFCQRDPSFPIAVRKCLPRHLPEVLLKRAFSTVHRDEYNLTAFSLETLFVISFELWREAAARWAPMGTEIEGHGALAYKRIGSGNQSEPVVNTSPRRSMNLQTSIKL